MWGSFGHGCVAAFQDGGWTELLPSEGWSADALDICERLVFRSATWQAFGLQGVGTPPDAVNRLAATPVALFTHTAGSGDLQFKVNKAAEADSGSLVFKTGFAGHAEIGLCGGNKLNIQTSADGAIWTDTVTLDHETGFTALGGTAAQYQLDVPGTVGVRQSAGGAHLTNDNTDTMLALDESVAFENFSGLILAVNLLTGSTGLYLCGGGVSTFVAFTNAPPSTLSFAASPNRCVFTNSTGAASAYRLLALRIRDGA